MAVRYLREDDVLRLMDMEASINVVEEAFRHLASGEAQNVPRARAFASGVALHTMSAAADYLNLVGWKAYATTRQSARFHVAAYRADTAEMVVLIEADHLGRLRTGAASGVATKYLAADNARTVGLFGTGRQARTQLEAVCAVRDIDSVTVYSRDAGRRTQFAQEMAQKCGVDIIPVDTPDAAATQQDIVITATTSKVPLFDGTILSPGTHLNVAGGNYASKAEVDATTVRRADRIVCDNTEQCRIEAGELITANQSGDFDWSDAIDLSDVVSGRQPGRSDRDGITLFKSVGLAIEDLAMAAELLKRAEQQQVGITLPF